MVREVRRGARGRRVERGPRVFPRSLVRRGPWCCAPSSVIGTRGTVMDAPSVVIRADGTGVLAPSRSLVRRGPVAFLGRQEKAVLGPLCQDQVRHQGQPLLVELEG